MLEVLIYASLIVLGIVFMCFWLALIIAGAIWYFLVRDRSGDEPDYETGEDDLPYVVCAKPEAPADGK